MKSRKIIPTILHAGQQRRRRHKEQTFGHIGRRTGWDDVREWHWNIYMTVYKIDSQWEPDVWHREPKAGALRPPGVMGWGEGWDGGSGGREHMYVYGQFMFIHTRGHHNIVK